MKTKTKILGFVFMVCLFATNLFSSYSATSNAMAHDFLGSTADLNAAADTVYKYGFEYGWGSWSVDNGVWEIGYPDTIVVPHSGDSCAATVLSGNYPDYQSSRLISPPLILLDINLQQTLSMRFWHWFAMGYNDKGIVQISVDSAGTWQPWETVSNEYLATSPVWSVCEVEISKYANKRVRLGFYLFQFWGASGTNLGWYVDDVCVIRRTAPDSWPPPACWDFEDGWGDWWADNGIWEMGHPDTVVSPYSGLSCAGTVLNKNYPDYTHSRLVSPPFRLPGTDPEGEGIYLEFWHWFAMGYNDKGIVQISVDSADVWVSWETLSNDFTGTSSVWSPVKLGISKYAGMRVRFGFYLSQYWAASGTGKGWYVDDVCVTVLQDALTVLNPNGGEIWEMGLTHTVNWYLEDWSGTFTFVKIELSRNAGKTWETLVESTSNNGFWQGIIEGPASDSCLIKISDASDGVPWDVSDDLFTIGGAGLTVISPNGGEMWCAVETDTIKWSSFDVETVIIEYTSDGGSNWENIISSTSSDGIYLWKVPSVSSTDCLVRICDVGGDPCDQSNSRFTIPSTPSSPTMISPVNRSHDVDLEPIDFQWNLSLWASSYWLQVDDDSTFYSPKYDSSSIDDTTQQIYGLSYSPTYYWRVKASNFCDTSDWSSAWQFTTSAETQFVFFENWEGGGDSAWSVDNGVWQVGMPTSGPGSAYSGDKCAATILDGNYPNYANSRLISPPIIMPSTGNVRLRFWHWFRMNYTYDYGQVQVRSDGGSWETVGWAYSMESGAIWSLTEVDLSSYLGHTIEIAFRFYSNSSGQESGWYVEDISIVQGASSFRNPEDWEEDIGDWWVDNGVWQVGMPTSGPGLAYSGDKCAATILNGDYPNYVNSRLISPKIPLPGTGDIKLTFWHWFRMDYTFDYGEVQVQLEGGSWDKVGGPYTPEGGGIWSKVIIPLSSYAGQTVQIAFYFVSNSSGQESGWYVDSIWVSGMPDTSEGTITVLEPNGGEILCVGNLDTIEWSSSNVDTVKIDYSINGGTDWTEIVSKTPCDGSYPWTVPEVYSSNCLIQICDIDGGPCDQSNTFFTITTDTIWVVSPVGGENLCEGNVDTIKWYSTYIESLKIDYSTNGGSDWINIAEESATDSTYIWTIPNTLSDNCLVRICDIDGSPCDQSDSSFSISMESVDVYSPNGGETWHVETNQDITWDSDCIANVKIDYTTDGGSNWINIVSNTSSDGNYKWVVPDAPSDSCLVKICDMDGTPCDTSDSVFTISKQNITLTSPTGGEDWCVHASKEIIWEYADIDSIMIYYSFNQGSTWDTVVACTTNAGTYSWVVPDTPSDLCRVKVCNCDESLCDQSDSNFTILTTPLTPILVSPDSGSFDIPIDPVLLEWNDVASADSYHLQVDTISDFSSPLFDNTGVTDSCYEVLQLETGVTYYWRVRAINQCGIGQWSNIWHFTAGVPRARIIEYYPSDYEYVDVRCSVSVTFSQDIDTTTVSDNNISITGRKDYNWDSMTYDNRRLVIHPHSLFCSLDTVKVTVNDEIKDEYGQSIYLGGNTDTSWNFCIYPLGDYNYDRVVNRDDVAPFTAVWNSWDTSKEIGPATGTPPHLLCNPDEKVDFEDLCVFVWMWNWFSSVPFFRPWAHLGEGANHRENLVAFIPDSSLGQNQSKEFGLVLKYVEDVMVISIILEYDPVELQIESIGEGLFLSKNGTKTLFLESIDEHSGFVEVVTSRLNGDPLGIEGTEPFAWIQMKSLTQISSKPLIVHYKIWNSQARPVFFGRSILKLDLPDLVPESFELFQNYPNPFNPQTAISYRLAKSSHVRLIIYNVAGQKVKTLVEGHHVAGNKTVYWDGTNDNGNKVTSGIYFFRLETAEFTQTKKMVILK